MSTIILCRGCAHEGEISTFPPCLGVYQDIRCPKCGSTNNAHNEEYQRRLFAKMREPSGNGPKGEGAQEAFDRDLSIQDAEEDEDDGLGDGF